MKIDPWTNPDKGGCWIYLPNGYSYTYSHLDDNGMHVFIHCGEEFHLTAEQFKANMVAT